MPTRLPGAPPPAYRSVKPDPVPHFKIANAGKQTHNFVIEGPGISQKLDSDLSRGDTGEITINLPAGSYTVYCACAPSMDIADEGCSGR